MPRHLHGRFLSHRLHRLFGQEETQVVDPRVPHDLGRTRGDDVAQPVREPAQRRPPMTERIVRPLRPDGLGQIGVLGRSQRAVLVDRWRSGVPLRDGHDPRERVPDLEEEAGRDGEGLLALTPEDGLQEQVSARPCHGDIGQPAFLRDGVPAPVLCELLDRGSERLAVGAG